MRRKIELPKEVKEAIQEHITKSLDKFHSEMEDVSSGEDALTVKLGLRLNMKKARSISVTSLEPTGKWRWRIKYRKLEDRSKGSEEKNTGADGIIELDVRGGGEQGGRKAALFQCKKKGNRYGNTLDQAAKLSNWREAAFFLEFAKDATSAIDIDDVIRNGGLASRATRTFLEDYLNFMFLECLVGDSDLEYFHDDRRLRWRSKSRQSVHANFPIKNRISLQVHAPRRQYHRSPWGLELAAEDIQNFRSDTAYEGLEEKELKNLLKAYHLDANYSASETTQDILQIRTTELLDEIAIKRGEMKETEAAAQAKNQGSTEIERTLALENQKSLAFRIFDDFRDRVRTVFKRDHLDDE